MSRRRAGGFAAALPLTLALGAPGLHPLHTTLTQLTFRPADRAVQISIRAFRDDFRAAVARSVGRGAAAWSAADVPAAAAFAYVRGAVSLSDRQGRPLSLEWCGVERTGDLFWLCLRAPAPEGLSGLRVEVRLLFDLYEDQINIVQASYGGRRESLLFTRGDAPKRLP